MNNEYNNGGQPVSGANSANSFSGARQGSVSGEYRITYAPHTNVYAPTAQPNGAMPRQTPQPQPNGAMPGGYRPQMTPQQAAQAAAARIAAQRAAQQSASDKDWFERNRPMVLVMGCIGIIVMVVLTVMITMSAMGAGDRYIKDEGEVTLHVYESPQTNVEIHSSDGKKLTYAQIAAKVRCAVVSITVYYDAYGWGTYVYSEGSGFIISEDGYIVTNSHVIGDDEYKDYKITATVIQPDGQSFELEADVIGFDVRTDLAVLRVDVTGLDIVVSELGQSSSLVLGDEVVAIGNPGGEQFAGSVTNGIVSGVDRIIDGDSGTSDSAMKYIQTNAAINPGNSGGPLLNMYGQVVGINSAKIVEEGYEGLGFAIPIDAALPVITELIEVGQVVRPALGVVCREITAQSAQWYDVPQGLLISGIYSKSGLNDTEAQLGDIIVACDGSEVTDMVQLQQIVDQKDVGDTVTLTLFRSGRNEQFDVTVVLVADNAVGSLMNNGGRP